MRGSKLQICFSRITSSKTCCTVIVVAQRVEVDDALLLGQVVGLALGRRQFQEGVADDLAAACRWPPPPWSRRRMQSRVSSGSILAGVSGGMRPGSTKAKMLTRSSMRFSIGVPVMAQLRSRWRLRTTCAVFDSRFLMRWASSSTTTSKCTLLVGELGGVARQQLVVDQLERAVGDAARRPGASRVSPPITSKGRSSAQVRSSRVQLMTSGLGQTTRARRISAGVEQQPQRDDHLDRLAQAHLVGEQGGVARHQEGDALDLVRDTAGTAACTCLPANRSSSGGCSR